MSNLRSAIVAGALTAALSIGGAQAGNGGHHGNGNWQGHGNGGNWWVAPAIVGGLLGAAAIASYPYYSYPAAPYYYAPPYPAYPQPRWCTDPYGRRYAC